MSAQSPSPSEKSPPPATSASKLTSLAARPLAMMRGLASSPLRLAVAGGVAVAVIGGIALGVYLLTAKPKAPAEPPPTLSAALAALDRGDAAEAKRLAEKLQASADLSTDEWGGPAFILGVIAAREVEQMSDRNKPAGYRAAAGHLEDAYKRGFPEGRRAEGLYLYGKMLYLGGRTRASRPILRESLKACAEAESASEAASETEEGPKPPKSDPTLAPQHSRELHRLLAGASLDDNPPDLQTALAENAEYLADPDLPRAERYDGLLQRAQILFRAGRVADCAAALGRIPEDAAGHPAALVLRGRMLLAEAHAMRDRTPASDEQHAAIAEKYRQAAALFRTAQAQDLAATQAASQASYLTAQCLLETGDQQGGLTQLLRTGKTYGDTPEALAADMRAAELAQRLGRNAEAIAAYRRVLTAIETPEEFCNPWISLGEIREASLRARKNYLAAGNYEPALQISRLLRLLVPSSQLLELVGEVRRAWGDSLVAEADRTAAPATGDLRRQARTQFRQAGEVFERLTEIEFTSRQYPARIWACATAYTAGQDYRSAARMLRAYLRYEPRERRAMALVELGNAYLALGEWQNALEALAQCIEQHPKDGAAFRARLLASQAAAAAGSPKRAEAFLLENLNGESLAPASKEWRDSLFALAELLHAEGRYAEAASRFEEAVTRYPDAPRTLMARYLMADAWHRCGLALRQQLAKEAKEASATTRAAHAAQARSLLEKSLGEFQRICDGLSTHRRDAEPLAESILRNSRFAIAELHCDLQQYDAALEAYTAAANQYPHRPEVLDAYVQIANIYRKLDRRAEARTSVEQAKVALRHLKPDARVSDTTNFDRQQWADVLEKLSSL